MPIVGYFLPVTSERAYVRTATFNTMPNESIEYWTGTP